VCMVSGLTDGRVGIFDGGMETFCHDENGDGYSACSRAEGQTKTVLSGAVSGMGGQDDRDCSTAYPSIHTLD
jgi:hypothetical protein